MKRDYRTAVNMNILSRKKAAAVPYWRIADEMQISEMTLQRRLRHQLPADQEAEVLEAIDRAAERMAAEGSAGI